jgi:hypothetical protein
MSRCQPLSVVMRSASGAGIALAVAGVLSFAPVAARANLIVDTFTGTGSFSDGPVNAQATITYGTGTMQIVLTDLEPNMG